MDTAGRLVVIGASAGGIEALTRLVAVLPSDFSAPLVIAQHLDPTRPSRLNEILAGRTALPVRTVTGREALQGGVIFVVPSDRHVEITDHSVGILEGGEPRPKPSVDLLFESATAAFGDGLIAVVLSGTGSDGAVGARAVHEAGGTVIIQNPETSTFPGMARSLAPATVDIVADVEQIGPILRDLLNGAFAPDEPENQQVLRVLLGELRERRGVDFGAYRRPTILRRLQRRLAATGTSDLADYRRYLGDHPEEERELIGSFLIKVTDFFRDPKVFTYLREHVLPGLIEEALRGERGLRIWSAGCATGEEAYSLAILAADLTAGRPDRPPVRIFATDLDEPALEFARRGVYPATALKNLPPGLIERYFRQIDGEYEVVKALRDRIVFGHHDLTRAPAFPQIDLLVCRNVLMYFTPELQQRVLQAFAFALRDDGCLVLGGAETTRPLAAFFTPEPGAPMIVRRTGPRTVSLPVTLDEVVGRPPLLPARPARPAGSRVPAAYPMVPPRELTEPEGPGALLTRLPVGVVVVDRRYDIQFINAVARRLLGVHGAAVGEDLVHLLESIATAPLRAAVDAAFGDEQPTSLEEVATAELGLGQRRYLHITCMPHREGREAGPPPRVLITVIDVTEMVVRRQEVEQAHEAQARELERLGGLMDKLGETNRRLLAANEELASAEESLRTTNEEYLVAAAEAQSANEELETYAEELQSTAEELETLNEELKATIEELTVSNADLDSRAQELTVERQASETGRARLAATLAAMADAVVVVDAAGQPLHTNAAYDELVGGTPFVLQDERGRPLPQRDLPQARAARGESFSMEFVAPTADGTPRWFEANGRPIGEGSPGAGRGVVVIRDITERSLRRLQEQFVAIAGHELRTPLAALLGYLQLHLRHLETEGGSERLRASATSAFGQAQRLRVLVDELLDVTRLRSGKLQLNRERVDLAAVAARAVEVARAAAPDRSIRLEPGPTPLPVHGDAGRLEDALLNLLSNAVRHAPGSEHIDVRLRRADAEAEVAVQDAGPGIPPAELADIFSPFHQVSRSARPSGTGLGLGLFIASEIISAHGGRIHVTSREGEGTTFTVHLPLLEGDGGTAGTDGPIGADGQGAP